MLRLLSLLFRGRVLNAGPDFLRQYRVLYPDGKISVRMRYHNAMDYAKIFGGEVMKVAYVVDNE